MLDPRERNAAMLLAGALLVMLIVHGIVTVLGPAAFAAQYSPASPAGSYVSVTGTILARTPTATGGHLLLTLADADVFVPADVAGSVPAQAGDVVVVTGTVELYRGKKEIVVASPDDIRVITTID
ncbi:MAG: hypothetical protein GKC04_01850 [Methanomicrobiales archaeon]|nr:hypothetical protein [Methanomicrobiales archaeon]